MRHFILIVLLYFTLPCPAIGQEKIDFQWWRETVDWDGVSHWSKYLTLSPRYLGPNALPVQEMMTGTIASKSYFEIGGQAHSAKGDQTQNLTLSYTHVIGDKLAVFNIFWVPYEIFQTSHERKVERRVFADYYHLTHAVGDIYVNTQFQVLKEEKHGIDAAARVGMKTASGTNRNPARFTDTPGYFFDGSFGKTFNLNNNKELNIRPYLMGGFFVWQTNIGLHPQNDAVMYGIGYKLKKGSYSFDHQLTGYYGYMNNGDRPMVQRLTLNKEFSRFSLCGRLQFGYADFIYNTFETRVGYKLDK